MTTPAKTIDGPLIEVQRLSRCFGSTLAVEDVSFRIDAGEIVGLLGPNGAGKSTLLRVISGYLPPSRGKVSLNGHDSVTASLDARRTMGYLPEQFVLYPDMRVYNYLKYRALLKGLSGRSRRRRVMDILTACNLESVAGKCIGTLSRGYRQRVGLADALVNNPPVLLLDEPGLGLDPNQLVQLREILLESREQRAVLLSSHALAETERLCGRVMIMNSGRIVAMDTPARLVERWRERNRFVVEVRGDLGAFLDGCRHMEHVREAVLQSGEPWSRVRIESDKDADLGGGLFELAVRTKCTLREFRCERDRLDDVFGAMTMSLENKDTE